jgi:NAD(P)H-quinone oxidoreductase subunit 5
MRRDHVGRWEQICLGLLCGLVLLSVGLLIQQAATAQALNVVGLTLDRLSATIALLVAGVGTVVYRFALRYLDGEPGQQRFLRWLLVTIVAAYILILATNLLVLFSAWLLTSIGLHQLLTFYRMRAVAYPPARKKFLISRLGDLALLTAIALIIWQWGTLDLNQFLAQLDASTSWPLALPAVALLVVIAALTKSAQFPFHSWLPETLEAPTPVSALMHAGIINAGGVLLLHFAPLLVRVPAALLLLTLIGTLTAVLGLVVMWAQTSVKRSLAWSTVSQMGFMMVQFGLAAFPAAILHLFGHGAYKAWAFLRTGGLPPVTAVPPKLLPAKAFALTLLGTLLALPALALAATVFGFAMQSLGKLALLWIVALAFGQLWVAIFQSTRTDLLRTSGLALLATVGGAFLTVGLYHGAELFYAPVLSALVFPAGSLATVTLLVPVVALTALALLTPLWPTLAKTPTLRTLYVHALHGFYLGAIADRLVARIWKSSITVKEVERA